MRRIPCLALVTLIAPLAFGCSESTPLAGSGGALGGAGAGGSGLGGRGVAGGGLGGGGFGDGGSVSDSCGAVPTSALVSAWTADAHFCLIRFASDVGGARQLAFAPNGDLFVGGGGRVVVLFDADGNGVSDATERSTFATVTGGNHGVALTATHVYASSDTTIYRWSYTTGQRVATGMPETVVRGIPAGGHNTRTLLVDGQSRLYVNIGSASNVDAPPNPGAPLPDRALIRRYDLASIPQGGYDAAAGTVFATGLRNEVGLSLDSQGRIWGVENGRDDLSVGGDASMFNDNPAEEVNLFDPARPGRHYGYPFCWSEGVWAGAASKGAGAQHLDPEQPGTFTEARCQDSSVVVPPAWPLGAHMAPLDVVEYGGAAYPAEFRGNLFVASHGSWNRDALHGHVGRVIVRLQIGANGMPSRADNFVGELGSDGALRQGNWSVRPVSVRVDAAGLLTFSDDASGTVHKIGYKP